MLIRFVATLLPVFTLISCRSYDIGGTFPGLQDPPRRVTLAELARYYSGHSRGLIRPGGLWTLRQIDSMAFTWDPYNKMKIVAGYGRNSEEIQGLFTFDEERFVHESGAPDFLTAVREFTQSQPLNGVGYSTRTRPYRFLGFWGSLFYPPIKTLTHPLSFYYEGFADPPGDTASDSPYFDPEFQKRLDEETQTELTYGNELRALFNGTQSYPEKLRLTAGAQKFLYVAVMTMVSDETGRELIRNMVARKRAGVDVRLITENLYTLAISNYAVGVLEREGIPVVRVEDKHPNALDRVFHNKIWIRDGEEAIIGGMNVLDYENKATGYNFLNRDTDILIRGPAVTSLLDSYIRLWKRYDKEHRPIEAGEAALDARLLEERASGVRGSEHYASWLGNPATRMNGICRTAVQGNNAEPQKIVTLLIRYLEAARHSFYITSPEIEFDLGRSEPEHVDILARLMKEKAESPGFFVGYITNGADGGKGESSAFLQSRVLDSHLAGERFWDDMLTPIIEEEGKKVDLYVRSTIRPLVESGVHAYQYFNYMHAKQFYFDRVLVGIGSWNFDHYSADNNHESAIFCLDEHLRQQMEEQLVLDMINAVPIVPSTAGEHPSQ
jgi:phosphatidylserine/phosphatidylglycerophosphate/cardiolipin synthase-like enzyme